MKAKILSIVIGNAGTRLSATVLLIICVLLLVSCSPVTRYSIYMTSDPVRLVMDAGKQIKDIPLTVASFNDARPIADKATIGSVVKSGEGPIPVTLAAMKPSSVVTAGVKSYMTRAGYTILKTSPAWDLKADSIPGDGGQFVLGGSIDEMEVSCEKSAWKANYKTKVTLSIYLADVKKGAVVYTNTVKGDSSRQDISITDKNMRRHLAAEINDAVTDAIAKLINPKTINRIIRGDSTEKTP
ncbi:MAG: hypothetical protein JW943_10785 [Deltaproteobacteria bacterium]|nr:hypothetical protein [Deltaproteobacteria bacterium]